MNYYKQAVMYLQNSDYTNALPLIESAIEHNEIDPYIGEYSRGVCFLELEDYSRAFSCFTRASALKPEDIDSFHGMAKCMIAEGSYKEGKEYLQTALDNGAEGAGCYNDMGVLCFLSKEYEEAVRWFLKAHEKDRANTDVLINLRDTYGVLGDRNRSRYFARLLRRI